MAEADRVLVQRLLSHGDKICSDSDLLAYVPADIRFSKQHSNWPVVASLERRIIGFSVDSNGELSMKFSDGEKGVIYIYNYNRSYSSIIQSP